MFCLCASNTNGDPGSATPGEPASERSAMLNPSYIGSSRVDISLYLVCLSSISKCNSLRFNPKSLRCLLATLGVSTTKCSILFTISTLLGFNSSKRLLFPNDDGTI